MYIYENGREGGREGGRERETIIIRCYPSFSVLSYLRHTTSQSPPLRTADA